MFEPSNLTTGTEKHFEQGLGAGRKGSEELQKRQCLKTEVETLTEWQTVVPISGQMTKVIVLQMLTG